MHIAGAGITSQGNFAAIGLMESNYRCGRLMNPFAHRMERQRVGGKEATRKHIESEAEATHLVNCPAQLSDLQ